MHDWRVYPGKDNQLATESVLYWIVELYDTRKQIHDRYDEINLIEADEIDEMIVACVMPMKSYDSNGRVKPTLGHVLLNKQELNSEVVAHESVHMAIGYLRHLRCGIKLKSQCDDIEERIAYATGRCAAQVASELHRISVW